MGTVGNQSPRERFEVSGSSIEGFLKNAIDLAKELDISVETVVATKHALELERQNDIAVQNGDYLDEHADGYVRSLDNIANEIHCK